jgi:hypothetical protein
MLTANRPIAANLKTLAQRFTDEMINAQDLGGALTEMVVEDFVEQNPSPVQGPGRAGLADVLAACSPPSPTCTGRCRTP